MHLGLVDGRRLTCVLLLHELLLRLHDRCILLPTDEGTLDRSVRAALTSASELWIHQAADDLLLRVRLWLRRASELVDLCRLRHMVVGTNDAIGDEL